MDLPFYSRLATREHRGLANPVYISQLGHNPEWNARIRELVQDALGRWVDIDYGFVEDHFGRSTPIKELWNPNIVILDLVGLSSEKIISTVRSHLRSIMTYDQKVIVLVSADLNVHDRNNLSTVLHQNYRIFNTVPTGEDIWESTLFDTVQKAVNEARRERLSTTGLPNRKEFEDLLMDLLFHKKRFPADVPTVLINADLRKIGMAGNDLYGEYFSNDVIFRFSVNLTAEMIENLPPISVVERVAFNHGGDAFSVVLRRSVRSRIGLNRLVEYAEQYCEAVTTAFERDLNSLYLAKPEAKNGFLVGRGVKDKFHKYVTMGFPVARMAILPFYPGVYQSLEDVSQVSDDTIKPMKEIHNHAEVMANTPFGFPASSFPEPTSKRAKTGFEKNLSNAAEIYGRFGSMVKVASEERSRVVTAQSYRPPPVEVYNLKEAAENHEGTD